MTSSSRSSPSLWAKCCRKLVLDRLTRITQGKLTVTLPHGARFDFGDSAAHETAHLLIHDDAFFSRIVLGADVGLGEAYVDGLWDSPDIVGLFTLLTNNRKQLAEADFLLTALSQLADRLRHLKRDNTLSGSRRNIQEHYDLGNDFYALFLDPTMMYSCGIYHAPGESLEQSQQNKRLALIEKLGINASDHILEIGCGWGGFAIEAVRQTGCRVTGITLSPSQQQWAMKRIRQEGLADRIDIRLVDYRKIEGHYDHIVSIEMLEAVGHRWLKTFFQRCDSLLKPGGMMGLQTITIPCERYDAHRKGTDWVRKHIFPGGHLPSLTAIRDAIAGHTSLVIHDLHEIGHHYVDTLRAWRQRFMDQLPQVQALGLDNAFQRKWTYYLATCESGFATRSTGNLQIVLSKK